ADGAEGVHIASMIAAFRALGHEVRLVGAAPATSGQASGRAVSGIRRMLPAILVELVAMAANVIDYMLVRQEIRRFRPDIVYKRHGRFDVGAGAAAVAGQV